MQQPSGGFRLIVRRGPQPNQIYELTKDVNTVGRDITNDITINDPEVSRHHARLTRQNDGYTIEDLGSTNGTFVNGQRLTGARQLSAGETIGLGETVTLAYESTAVAGMPPSPAAAPPPPQQAQPPQPSAPQPPQPSQRPPYESPPPQQPAPSPYAPPTAGTQQPPQPQYYGGEQPPSPYAYSEEAPGGGVARWILLGCGCFIVLCVIGAVVGIIVVDQTCAWDSPPLSDVLEVFGYTADASSSACQ
jgi:hypothetical protein